MTLVAPMEKMGVGQTARGGLVEVAGTAMAMSAEVVPGAVVWEVE